MVALFIYAGTSSTRLFSAIGILPTAPKTALTEEKIFFHG
jgi:hypothetical protein